MILSYVGYHGCDKESGKEVLRSKFLPSEGDRQWLGDGVYFFENDPVPAEWWAEQRKKFKEWMVLRSIIEVDVTAILDLLRQDHYKQYQEVLGEITKNARMYGVDPSEAKDGAALNFLCRKVSPHLRVIRAAFFWESDFTVNGHSRIRKSHIQLAVRDTGCIVNTNRHSEGPRRDPS